MVGVLLGNLVGIPVGWLVGDFVGIFVGDFDGDLVGIPVVGAAVVGSSVGAIVEGAPVVGNSVGELVGAIDGWRVVGAFVGNMGEDVGEDVQVDSPPHSTLPLLQSKPNTQPVKLPSPDISKMNPS